MNTLINIAMVVGYIVIGGIVAGILTWADTYTPYDNDYAFGILFGLIWPAGIAIAAIALVALLPFKLGEKIVKAFRKWRFKY